MKITNREMASKYGIRELWDCDGLDAAVYRGVTYEFSREPETEIGGYRIHMIDSETVSIEDIGNADILDAMPIYTLALISEWASQQMEKT